MSASNSTTQTAVLPSQISVVVQGAIAGKPADAPHKKLTLRCLESIRRILPGSEIILSTWKGSNVSGLPFDVLVENDDPGATHLDVDRTLLNNINRQIVSTTNGLQCATRPFAIKMRTDLELLSSSFIDYFSRFPRRCEDWKIFRQRVVACTVFSINPRRFAPMPYHPSDWFFFGLRDDLLDLWDIPLAPEPETSRWYDSREKISHPFMSHFTNRYAPEQTLWGGFLRKHGDFNFQHMTDLSDNAIQNTEISIANNLVLVPPEKLRIRYLKGKRGSHWDKDRFAVYTHGEWLSLYQQYCDASVQVPLDFRSAFNRFCYFWFRLFSPVRPIPGSPSPIRNLDGASGYAPTMKRGNVA